MTDFHTHLLPGVDDGSKDIKTSLQLLQYLLELGFDKVVLSSHFYPNKETIESFIHRRNSAYELLKSENTTASELYLGCECYLHEYIFNNEDISDLCMEHSKYLLTELSYNTDAGKTMLKYIERLISTFNVTPILAHIERYPFIMNDEGLFNEFIDSGCLAQVNLISLSNFFTRRKLCDYIKKGYVQFMGTDTHTMPFDIKSHNKSTEYITKRLGNEWKDMFKNLRG